MFENFGEYNFNIDVNAHSYESMKQGLSLVEQEMPASISFHVPDSQLLKASHSRFVPRSIDFFFIFLDVNQPCWTNEGNDQNGSDVN